MRLLICVVLMAVSPVLNQTQTSGLIVGTWRLVSFVAPDSTGQQRAVWGDRPSGLIVYTRDGHVAAQLYDPRRPRLGEIAYATALAPIQPNFGGLYTYFGTFSVDTLAKTVTHHVEGAMAPDWVGSNLIRGYRFLGPDRLELRVVTDAAGHTVADGVTLVWERVQR